MNHQPKKSSLVVVGSGLGGLATAIRLAVNGFNITLCEQNTRMGGKLNLWEAAHPARSHAPQFRFDTGPSLLTMPFVLADLFSAAGKRLEDYLDLIRPDPIARFTWADGSHFDLQATDAAMAAEVTRFAPEDSAGFRALLDRGRHIWDLSAELFLFNAPEQVLKGKAASPSASAAAGWQMLTVPFRIGMFSTFASLVDRHLKNQRLREVMYQYATYSGASPFRAPATLAVIPHAERYFGGWYPRGGMYKIAEALEALARELGVEIRTDCRVERILTKSIGGKKMAVGVKLAGGEEVLADAVIANSDAISTYRDLIDASDRPRHPDAKINRLDPGGSGVVLLLGVEGNYPQLSHHTKFMPADYRSDLTAMFETRTIPADPCIYVCATTRTDPTQAPENCENLFVLASAPALDGAGGRIDWSAQGPLYEQQLIRTLQNRFGLSDLERRIVVRRRFTPADLKSLYNANFGSIYGLGSNSRRAAFLRPPNRDKDVQRLYFVGGATHPGGGLPLVMLSGKIVSEMVVEDLGP